MTPSTTTGASVSILVLLALLAAGCGNGGGGTTAGSGASTTAAEAPTSTTTPPTTGPTTTEAVRGPLGSGEAVTLAFAGDASFQGLNDAAVADPQGLLSAIAPVLGAADVSVVNLEAALGYGGQRVDKQFAFQVPEQALEALRAAGTDAVTMANNHGMDYGLGGLRESLRIKADTGFPVLGIGADEEEAYAPWVTEVRGQRIGVIAANDVFDSSVIAEWTAGPGTPGLASSKAGDRQERLLAEVGATRSRVDTLAVFLHYGRETETCPNARQVELATAVRNAGADIIVGSHAHRLQGMGYLDDGFVAYGLSNFVFQAPSEPGRRSGVLTVTATGRHIDGYDWAPAALQGNVPVPLEGTAAEAERAAMDELRGCTGLSAAPTGATHTGGGQ